MSNIGGILKNLDDLKKQDAQLKFDEQLELINDKANSITTEFGDIEKGAGTVLGSIIGFKSLYSSYNKLKNKLKGKSEDNTEEANEADNEPDPFEADEEDPDWLQNVNQEGGELPEDEAQNINEFWDDKLNNFNPDEDVTENAPESEETGDLFGDLESNFGTMEGIQNNGSNFMDNLMTNGESAFQTSTGPAEIEMTSMTQPELTSVSATQSSESIVDADTMGQNISGSATYGDSLPMNNVTQESSDALEQAAGEGEDAVSDLVDNSTSELADIGTDVAESAEVGVDTAAEIGVDTAVDVASAALAPETLGLSSIIPLVLEGIGLLGSGATVATSIIESDKATADQQASTIQAQKDLRQQEQATTNYEGKFAPDITSAVQSIQQN